MRFKSLWDENIVPRIADSAQHMMLSEALPNHILSNMFTLSNSAEDLWKLCQSFCPQKEAGEAVHG